MRSELKLPKGLRPAAMGLIAGLLLVLFSAPASWGDKPAVGSGLWPVVNAEGKWGLADLAHHKLVIPYRYTRIEEYPSPNGYTVARGGAVNPIWPRDKTVTYYLLDSQGKVAMTATESVAHLKDGPLFQILGDNLVAACFGSRQASVLMKVPEKKVIGAFDDIGLPAGDANLLPVQGTCSNFSVSPRQTAAWGYATRSGSLVIPYKYQFEFGFTHGLANVRTEKMKWGVINEKGQWVLPPIYKAIDGNWSDGVAAAFLNGKWFYIDQHGKNVFGRTFKFARPFHEGVATVELADGSLAVLDRKGSYVFGPGHFDGIGGCSEGRIGVYLGTKSGFIDTQGKWVFTIPGVKRLTRFYRGLTFVVMRDRSSEYLNREGRVVWKDPPVEGDKSIILWTAPF